jgi:hypothetical protein
MGFQLPGVGKGTASAVPQKVYKNGALAPAGFVLD